MFRPKSESFGCFSLFFCYFFTARLSFSIISRFMSEGGSVVLLEEMLNIFLPDALRLWLASAWVRQRCFPLLEIRINAEGTRWLSLVLRRKHSGWSWGVARGNYYALFFWIILYTVRTLGLAECYVSLLDILAPWLQHSSSCAINKIIWLILLAISWDSPKRSLLLALSLRLRPSPQNWRYPLPTIFRSS